MRILIAILFALSFASCSDKEIVNMFSFIPDKNIPIAEKDLPGYIHLVKFKTIDDLMIQGLYYLHDKAGFRPKLIIYFHGNSENMYHKIKEGDRLFQMGYDVLIVSYRGYAGSRGTPSEKGIYTDGKSALQYAEMTLKYRIDNIVIFGFSIGTTVAVDVSQGQNISKLILVAPLSTGIEFARARGLGLFVPLMGSPYESLDKIDNVKCPLLIIHGTKDDVIPYNLGKRLYEKFNGKKTMVAITNGRHDNLAINYPDIYWPSIKRFLTE